MTLRYEAASAGDAGDAWNLLARPSRWSEWAPHVRGAWGLGAPEVEAGARGAARLFGFVPVPARVTAVEPGRSWSWRVGLVDLHHQVMPRAGGCVVAVEMRAARPVEAFLRAGYGPLVKRLVTNLSRAAEA